MSGRHTRGVQAIIKNTCPSASYMHCARHTLNLVVNEACEIRAIRNTQGTVQEICSFFNSSAKRTHKLQTSIEEACPKTSHSRLKSLCATRWVQRHETVNIVLELYPGVLLALEILSEEKDRDTSLKAESFLTAICDTQFIMSLLCMHKASCLLLPASKQLH
ncbi:hypothetical protein AVEN_94354-1 [Araneus ventricosus]|uniref:Zinc finger BED domain-containing protein 5 n=1 Tax=Araneus ventricosus TaxID=182803 RepID=A0A4Y2ECA0_ARAVE|nr:hypothetical protein AVEN_94354-1 [Araneus ventricosus]